jgi:hypothetical protein
MQNNEGDMMEFKKVKDLMLPLNEYALIDEDATLFDAFFGLEEAQSKVHDDKQPHRAILVLNKEREVVGKIGHLAFLKALEPKYSNLGNLSALSQARISPEYIESIMEDFRFWDGDIADICKRSKKVKVKDVMHPITENIDEEATLMDAIHRIIIWQCLSVLVTRGSVVVGILRLSDIFDEIANCILYQGK